MTLAELIRCGIMIDSRTTITITKKDAEDGRIIVRGNMKAREVLALADEKNRRALVRRGRKLCRHRTGGMKRGNNEESDVGHLPAASAPG